MMPVCHGKELNGLRVLVVEDSLLVADAIADMLQSFGCEVVGPAAHVKPALTMVRAEHLDGAVLDVNLGGEHCFPIAAELQERGIPFIFLTGYASGTVVPPQFRDTPRIDKPFYGRTLVAATRRFHRAGDDR
jgi:DNA-binding response OmpR family regulator